MMLHSFPFLPVVEGAAAPAGTAKAASYTFRLELVATHAGSL